MIAAELHRKDEDLIHVAGDAMASKQCGRLHGCQNRGVVCK